MALKRSQRRFVVLFYDHHGEQQQTAVGSTWERATKEAARLRKLGYRRAWVTEEADSAQAYWESKGKRNPGYSRKARGFIGQKISKLAHEGYEAPQRLAIAMQMARKKGLKVPKRNIITHKTALKYAQELVKHERKGISEHLRNPEVEDEHCYAVVDYGTKPIAGARFMVNCLPDVPLQMPHGVRIMASRMTLQGARALAEHLNDQARRGRAKIDVLERPNPRFLRRGRHGAFFGVRRSNPTLAIMGANPPAAGDDIEATWAFLSYRRPDDPDGKRVVREHEFPDGFVAVPLRDGSILLRHPQGHNLWTRR